ncbi:MAG: hypothetical protein JNIBNLAF_01276 [Nitrosomonas europaea]|uniref:hypothetical protein n=2 Tax=Nitrosomonas TaxID=914 RepID=UPI0023F4BC20|nr:hypothetical protein [Nitrosomonas europaea]MBV6389629.1 hypothetical protein [Nitrosomonas europaea]
MAINNIDGYTYNPQDGKWYGAPPAPDLGWYQWSDPASSEQQKILDQLRDIYINDNEIEKRTPNNDSLFDNLKKFWDRAKSWVWPRDLIILDLDGDDLETVGLASNVYFDHDGDGMIDANDPAFAECRRWHDANLSGLIV